MDLLIHNDKAYQKIEAPLFRAYKEVESTAGTPDPEWLGAKLPWDMWVELVAWCQVTQEKNESEALVYLFYDVETNKWSRWYVPQISQGMTVEANTADAKYAAERKQFPDMQFGSLHHHCTMEAFASGTDKADECDREGIHFTVGNLGAKKHSLHCRISLAGMVRDIPTHTVIEMSPILAHLPEGIQASAHEAMCKEPVDASVYDFTPFLGNITIRKHTSGNGTHHHQPTWWDDAHDTEETVIAKITPTEAFFQEMGEYVDTWVSKADITKSGQHIMQALASNNDPKAIAALMDPIFWNNKVLNSDYQYFMEEMITVYNFHIKKPDAEIEDYVPATETDIARIKEIVTDLAQ